MLKLSIILLFGGLTLSQTAYAQISAKKIASRVQVGIEQKIEIRKIADTNKVEAIHQNIKLLTNAIRDSSMKETLDEETASWLIQGIVKYISDLGIGGLSNTNNQQIKDLTKLLGQRLNGMDNNKAGDWMAYSNKLLKEARIYRMQYQKYILKRLSTPKYIKVRFSSRSRGMYLGSFSIDSVASGLANMNDMPQVTDYESSSSYDATDNAIDSRMLTLSLAKLFKRQFHYQVLRDKFSYGSIVSNLFSEYDYNHPVNELDFLHARPYIDKYLAKVIRDQEGTLLISYDGLLSTLYTLTDIREPGVYDNPDAFKGIKSKLDASGGFRVKFRNYGGAWKLIVPGQSNTKNDETNKN